MGAHCRESLRPINKLRDGKYVKEPVIGQYRLKASHELWGAGQSKWVVDMWYKYKAEWTKRGGKGFEFESSATLQGVDSKYHNDYAPTKQDYRHNLARLCERFRNRKKGKPYHLNGKAIDTTKEFRQYIKYVKQQLEI